MSLLAKCDILPKAPGSKSNIFITQLINDLEEARGERVRVEAENAVLKAEVEKMRFWQNERL